VLYSDVITSLQNSTYWATHAYNSCPQPSKIKIIDGSKTNIANIKGRWIYGFDGSSIEVYQGYVPTSGQIVEKETAYIKIRANDETDLFNMVRTINRMIKAYHPSVGIIAITRQDNRNGLTHSKEYLLSRLEAY